MIDQIILHPMVHVVIGVCVLLALLAASVYSVFWGVKRAARSSTFNALWLLAQGALMLQVLIGIKLLDQGLGVMQLYIHYLGGLGAMLFLLVYYWLPEKQRLWRWTPALLAIFSLLFAGMAFFVGASYVPGGV